jgi:hypothetical protein
MHKHLRCGLYHWPQNITIVWPLSTATRITNLRTFQNCIRWKTPVSLCSQTYTQINRSLYSLEKAMDEPKTQWACKWMAKTPADIEFPLSSQSLNLLSYARASARTHTHTHTHTHTTHTRTHTHTHTHTQTHANTSTRTLHTHTHTHTHAHTQTHTHTHTHTHANTSTRTLHTHARTHAINLFGYLQSVSNHSLISQINLLIAHLFCDCRRFYTGTTAVWAVAVDRN